MDERQFENSVRLFKLLGETVLPSGRDLSTELCLGTEISLWEVMAPYLVLYRFPWWYMPEGSAPSLRQRLDRFIRPYRGLGGHFRDFVFSPLARNEAGCARWPEGEATVLFLGFSPTHYRDVLHPVAALLMREHRMQGVVIGDSPSWALSADQDAGPRFQTFWEHWENDVEDRVQAALKQLQAIQKSLLNRSHFKAFSQNVRASIDRTALRREMSWLFWREFRRLISQIGAACHILRRHRPALIIFSDDTDPQCRIYSLLGRLHGIPSLIVQQGFASPAYPDWSFFSADAVAAMGQAARTAMISQGIPADRITVTGHPGFDRLMGLQPDACARVRADLKITDGQRMVLFASQPPYVGVFNTPQIRREMMKAVVRAAASVENVRLVIKPHPAEDVHEIVGLIGPEPGIVVVDKAADITLFIKACDVLITFFSQSALQAIYAGKPVINVAFPGCGGATLFLESGATWIARSPDEIVKQLRKLTGQNRIAETAGRNADRERFLLEWAHLPDGRAAERVVQTALLLLEERGGDRNRPCFDPVA